MIGALKAVLIALATVVGVITAIVQIFDYLSTGKLSFLLMAVVVIFSAVPITMIVITWIREGSGLGFSWNTFRTVAAISASAATLTLGTIMIVVIIHVANPSPPEVVAAPTTSPLPPTPPMTAPSPTVPPSSTTCPPAGQPGAKVATVVNQVQSSYPLQPGPAYYKAALVGRIQLEIGGQLFGSIPPGKQLFLLTRGDPTTIDATPKHSPGNGIYYRSNIFRIVGDCYIRPQTEIGYPGAQGITFMHQLVLVDIDKVVDFTAPMYDEGYDDYTLDSFGAVRLAYFDVPTNNFQ